MDAAQENQIGRRHVWIRGLIMLFFMVAFGLAQTIQTIAAVVQFFWLLLNGEPNTFIARFGTSLAKWLSEASRFLTCATDDKPFPWTAWPESDSPEPPQAAG